MHDSYIGVGVFFVLGIAFVAGTFAASWLLRPHHPHPEKLVTYECGEKPTGGAWIQFRIVFYCIALSFVIFDVEVVYLIPWGLALGRMDAAGQAPLALGAMGLFLLVLMLGWLWEMRRRAYDWE